MAANAAIFERISRDPRLEGMATTVVCLLILGTRVYIGWAGDSRAYRYREGMVTQLTQDHNRVQLLVQQGILAPEDVKFHPARSHLYNALGMSRKFFPEIIVDDVKPGDLYMLSTDGFHEGLSTEQIAQAYRTCLMNDSVTPRRLQSLATTLINQTLEGFGGDNLTVAFVYVEPPVGSASHQNPKTNPIHRWELIRQKGPSPVRDERNRDTRTASVVPDGTRSLRRRHRSVETLGYFRSPSRAEKAVGSQGRLRTEDGLLGVGEFFVAAVDTT